MALQCGIIGLPNAGKSTLFNALTASDVPAENYPFCTIDPNVGIVPIPDGRLTELERIFHPEKVTPAVVEFVDIAGLVRGANKGEGLGNQFLSQIRQMDALIHVVRCFEDENVTHVEGSLDPVRDAELIETELLLKDLEGLEKRVNRVTKTVRSGDKDARSEMDLLEKLVAALNDGAMARSVALDIREAQIVQRLALLTSKPILYVANVDEDEIQKSERGPLPTALVEYATNEGNNCIRLCGQLEQEIAVLNEEEKQAYLAEFGQSEPGLDKLIHAAYRLLGYETFFTGSPTEVRAWTVAAGAKAPEAAGAIHTDFQRGFIKAEVFSYADLIRLGSEQAVKEAGLARQEGKEYRVRDGDVIFFKFNV